MVERFGQPAVLGELVIGVVLGNLTHLGIPYFEGVDADPPPPMRYVDGYLLPVPKKNLKIYKKIATKAGKTWKKYGAVAYLECSGDDLKHEWSTLPFPKMAKCKPGETVVFSFVIFKSRKHRNQVNVRVFKDPFTNPDNQKDKPMPFDMKRMAYGGFNALVDL